MSQSRYEEFVEGSRTDPNATPKVNADGTATQVILNLGDRAKTIHINDTTQHIVLLNKLVEWRSHREQEFDEDGRFIGVDRSGGDGPDIAGGTSTPFTAAQSGYGIHIAAATGDASDNAKGQGPKRDSAGYERGHESNKIDLRDTDNAISDELIALLQMALRGGAAGSEDDLNLRIGDITFGDRTTGEGFVVEIIVDGKWSSDVLQFTGTLARDMLAAVPEAVPGFDVGDAVAQVRRVTDFAGGSDPSETISIGDSTALPSGSQDDETRVDGFNIVFNDVFDLFAEIDKAQNNFGGDDLRPEETTLLIQAGVFMALTGQNVIDGLHVVFEGDPDTTDSVTLELTNISGVIDRLALQGPGVSSAIAEALGRFSTADFGAVSIADFAQQTPALFLRLIQNTAPRAEDGQGADDEDTIIRGTVTATDFDAPDTDLTFALEAGPADGIVFLESNGDFVYIPRRDGFGTESFFFTATDQDGLSATGTFTLNINAVDDAPSATPIDAGDVTEDDPVVTLDLLSTATDADTPESALFVVENSVEVTDETGPVAFTFAPNGTLKIDPSQYDALRADAERNVTVSYTISDGALTTQNTATLKVLGVNDAPVAVDDHFETDEDTDIFHVLSDIISNDEDLEGDALFSLFLGLDNFRGIITDDPNKTTSFNGIVRNDWIYSPIGRFDALKEGETATDSFTYRLRETSGVRSEIATVSFTINGVNDAPIAVDDALFTDENTPIPFVFDDFLANDSDPEGDTILVTGYDDRAIKGFVAADILDLGSGDSTFEFTYVPNGEFEALPAGATEIVRIPYTIRDDFGATSTAFVNITITGVNDLPVAGDDTVVTNANTPVEISFLSLLSNDTDPDSEPRFFKGYNFDGIQGSVRGDVLNNVIYTPDARLNVLREGEFATDSFTYTIGDPSGAESTATVNITINGVNDAPIAVDDDLSLGQGAFLSITAQSLMANDSDVDRFDTLKVADFDNSATQGFVAQNDGGNFFYSRNGAFDDLAPGTTTFDSFTYTITDDAGAQSTAKVTIEVESTNIGPEALGARFDVYGAGPYGFETREIIADDYHPAGESFVFKSFGQPIYGTVVEPEDGIITYVPDLTRIEERASWGDYDYFAYTIIDDAGFTSTGEVFMVFYDY